MKKIFIPLVVLSILTTVSCVSINPENAAMIQGIFAKEDSTVVFNKPDEEFKEMAHGQWTVLRKQEGNTQVYLKYSVYKGPNQGDWIEVQDLREKKEIIIQYKVKNLKAESIKDLGIIEGRYYQNDKRNDRAAMSMTLYLYPLFGRYKTKALNANMTTPAGIFHQVHGHSGSTRLKYSFKSKAVSITIDEVQSGTMFYHPALPMNGIIGWKADKDKAEVVEFSFLGAQPARPL